MPKIEKTVSSYKNLEKIIRKFHESQMQKINEEEISNPYHNCDFIEIRILFNNYHITLLENRIRYPSSGLCKNIPEEFYCYLCRVKGDGILLYILPFWISCKDVQNSKIIDNINNLTVMWSYSKVYKFASQCDGRRCKVFAKRRFSASSERKIIITCQNNHVYCPRMHLSKFFKNCPCQYFDDYSAKCMIHGLAPEEQDKFYFHPIRRINARDNIQNINRRIRNNREEDSESEEMIGQFRFFMSTR